MHYTERITKAHPKGSSVSGQVTKAIDTIVDNAMTCRVCADACLHEDMVKDLVRCIELDNDCAASCEATAQMLLQTGSDNYDVQAAQLDACARSCSTCAEECEKHARMHEHCRICAESCREAEQACREALQSMRQPTVA